MYYFFSGFEILLHSSLSFRVSFESDAILMNLPLKARWHFYFLALILFFLLLFYKVSIDMAWYGALLVTTI